MGAFGCCGGMFNSGLSPAFAALSRAAAKSAAAKLRNLRILPVRVDWTRRAETCERCPLRVIRRGVSYCGTPFLDLPDRDPATDGCGCPTHDKAKSPAEHCPLTITHRPATETPRCDCKWCADARRDS